MGARCSHRSSIIAGMVERGKITLVPTPIGNLGDITLRAIEALRAADAVLCEDTRVTGKLLAHLDIKKPLIRLDENTIRERTGSILDRMHAGEVFAYCSDAGMPGVSDPGMHLVAQAREAGLPVEVLPGASAATTAYVASGFSDARFLFAGFMPRKDAERAAALEHYQEVDAALIFYESPHRLVSSLAAVANAFPARRVAVCRELTKLHEEVIVDTAEVLAVQFAERETAAPIKGEIALVLEGPTEADAQATHACQEEQALSHIRQLIAQGARPKDAAKEAASAFGIARNAAYQMALDARDEAAS